MNSKRFATAIFLAAFALPVFAAPPEMISTEQFAADVTQFLQTEIAAHAAAVTNLNPPQPTVLGVPTAGDFTWGSFMRALSAVAALTGETNIAGRDVPAFAGQIGLIEAREGGKTFAQLGSALTLRHYGMNLATNALWQSLTPAEQNEWRSLLNPARFYDFQTHHVINLPENYMGVASRIVTMDVLFGLVTNRAEADNILDHAAGQFLHGALYTDDNMPTGRYDRYSQEYARFVYDAAGNLGRKDIQAADAPALKAVMKTWWGLVTKEGYSYPWGRTIGDMSYMDTLDIVGFLAEHPEFRPAPLPELASVYFAAFNSLRRDYEPDRHLLNMFGFGRGNFHYMTVQRQWQQTTDYFYKSAESLEKLLAAMRAEHVTEFPATPDLPPVARFDFFRKGAREAGVWLVRQGPMRFALPFTTGGATGFRAGLDDYLPAPHGLPGFAAPVEQIAPVLTPFLELTNGQVLAACDGADEIIPDKDGFGVTALWHRFAEINVASANTNADLPFGVPEKFADLGLTSEVKWKLDGDTLTRTEKITAAKPITIRHFSVIFPSTANSVSTRLERGRRIDTFTGANATLEVSAASPDVAFTESLQATGNSAMGKGTRGAIPLILQIKAADLKLKPGQPFEWTFRIKSRPE
jgi:hypothetical protein